MGTLIKLTLLILAVGLVSLTFVSLTNADDNEQLCSTECTDGIANGDIAFAENVKYSYTFNGKTVITAPTGTSEGQSEVSITGIANIIGTKSCGAILYLKYVEITQGSKIYIKTKLEGSSIMFSFNNGKVGQKICSTRRDSAASMNLKRAILSALQVSSVEEGQKELFETDIQGTCNTTYSSVLSGTVLNIRKTKDLTQCTGHDKINLLGMTSSQSNLVYDDSPFSKASHTSDIEVVDSIIRSVNNQDTILYQPFGPIDVVTKITVSMSLNLKKRSQTNSPQSLTLKKTRSIVFEKSTSTAKSTNSDGLVLATQLAMQNLEPIVDMDGAKYYADLISLLKIANKEDILNAFEQIKNDGFDNPEIAQKTFIDALMAANSGESIAAVAKLIDGDMLSDSLAASWFKNLANAKYPTKEAIDSASNLLKQRGLKDGYIGVGSMIRNYIKDTQDTKSLEIENALNNLATPLKKAFDTSLSSDIEDQVIASLRGIGNAQYINSDVADQIVQIIMDKSVKQRIKSAALDMAKTYAENPKIQKVCENIFTDQSEDSELRLLAFKVFATYPTNYKANVIKDLLDDKKCQLQIQSYLLSYLRSLQNTIDETKLEQKKFYEGIQFKSPKKSLGDILRYSQNLEYSYQSPLLNSGVMLNGDILYSYNSFLARSSSIATKALVFGRQHSIFDIDTRIENIEPLLEKIFGPEGYFAKHKGSTLDGIKNYVNQAIMYAKNKKLNNVDSTMSAEKISENVSKEDLKNIYIDIVFKVFGNDLGWFSLQGNERNINYQYVIDAIFKNVDNSILNKKNLELNIRKQIQIADYEKKYPTSSGLPVSLKIQATSAIKIDLSSTFDLDNYLKHPENSNFAIKLIPSGSLTLNSLLTIDGYKVEVGNKISSSLHTSTGLDCTIETVKGRGFEMIYELPLNVMDVLSAKSEAYSTVQENGESLIETPLINTDVERITYTKTLDDLKNTIGLSFSGQYDFPWNGELKSILPYSGPSSFSLKISKEDENLTKYIVKGTYDFNDLSPVKYIKFVYATPGSNINRGVELIMAYKTHGHDTFLMQFKTPSNKITLQSALINSDLKKIIELKYENGGEHIFKFGLVGEVMDTDTIKYTPIYEALYAKQIEAEKVKNPYVPNIDIEGYVIVKENVDSQSGITKSIAKRSLDSQYSIKPKTYLYDVAAIMNNVKNSLNGYLTIKNKHIESEINLNTVNANFKHYGYISGNYPDYKLVLTLDMIKNKQGELSEYSDEYQPDSKLLKLLYKIKTLNIATSQELRIESPYVFKSANRIVWDKNDYIELNGDFLIENNDFTMYGNVATTDLYDLVLNANITILPRTQNSGKFVLGKLEHSFNSDLSNKGHGHFKYVQDKDKKGGYFEFISRCPPYVGTFDFITQYKLTNGGLTCGLDYTQKDGTLLKANMSALANDIKFNADFNSPNPEYKSSVNVHGWSDKKNSYLFDTKLVWPSTHESNYMNAAGKLFLKGRQCNINGNIDFPLANLDNVEVSLDSMPNPENKDESIVTVRCLSKDQVYLSEKVKYKLTLDNGQLHASARNIPEDSQNFISPVKFNLDFNDYTDSASNTGKELKYNIELERNGQRFKYKRSLQFTNHMFTYRQLYKVDDEEQKVEMDLEYNGKDARNWSYNLKAKIISPEYFRYLLHGSQNLLEFNSNFELTSNSCNQGHYLNIYSSNKLDESYELKCYINNNKKVLQIKFGEREIRGIAHYNFEPISGGYKLTYAGQIWFDHMKNSNAESTLRLDSYYSFDNGLSSETDLNILIPPFQDKELSIKNNIQMLKSWENPFDVKLNLDIFSTPEQALNLYSSLKRSLENNGVLYSAKLKAKSDGMELDYTIKNSVFVSNTAWGQYLDISYVDSDGVKIPIQLDIELLPSGLTNKINIFDISVVNVDSGFKVDDGVLNARLNINYNDNPYKFKLLLNSNPSFNFGFGWNDKNGSPERLELEGSVAMNDAAVMSANHVINNNDVTPIGSVTKSLQQSNWWATDKQINSKQWNLIWQSLKNKFIKQFIDINNNLQNILLIAKDQRRSRMQNARRVNSQTRSLQKYTLDEGNKILRDVRANEYLPKIPNLILNTTEILLVNCLANMEPVDIPVKDLVENVNLNGYPKKIYDYYARNIGSTLDQLSLYFDSIGHDAQLAIKDLNRLLDMNIDKLTKAIPSEDLRFIKDYYNNVKNDYKNKLSELKDTIDELQYKSVDYINNNLPINKLNEEIEKLKSYNYKEKLWNEIHKYLQKYKATAPTKEFASFINTLDGCINKMLHDVPVNENDITNLRNKGIILAKSLIFDFSNYVDYNKAMSIYNASRKLSDVGKNVLNAVSSRSLPSSNDASNLLYDFSKYAQMYHKYLTPSNLLPPFKGQGVIMDSTNLITYNNQYYSFKPNTATYILAKDIKNNKFSILANYDNDVLTSITVLINNGETYVLKSGGSATVNGNSVNFPYINDAVKIWKSVYFFGIDAAVGLKIKCTLQFDMIKIFINGYYYGNVFGLLGTMYQEPTFDFKLPNRELSNDMESFLKAYRVSGSSNPIINNLVSTDKSPCPSLFSGMSSLKSCFPTISPVAYRSACNQIVSGKSQQDDLDKACLIVKTYVSMAKDNFATDCNIPNKCLTSTVNNQLVGPSSTVEISEKSDSADIIILFEESVENQNVFSVILKPFMEYTTKNFKNKGIADVNFIVIGYSGLSGDTGVHIYPASNANNYEEIMNNVPKWSEASVEQNSGLTSQFVESYKKLIGKNSKDKAYKLTGEFPFRPNAVKAVLTITQTVYSTDSALDVSQYTFDFITSCFVEQGIKFHLVAPINLQDSSNQQILGTNGVDTVYTLTRPKGTYSNGFTYDKSLETSLVVKTNGIMFDSKKFTTEQNDEKIIYLKALSKAVTKQAIKDIDVTKHCKSSVHDGIMTYTKCAVAQSQSEPSD